MGLNRELLRNLREKRGLTQLEAARRAGMKTRQHWNQIEAGRSGGITLDTLEKIAAAVGAKPRDLLVD